MKVSHENAPVVVTFVVAVATGATCLSRGRDGSPGNAYVRQHAAALRERTVPPGAESETVSGITRKGVCAEVHWGVATRRDWPTYREWVKSRLPPEFGTAAVTETRAEFYQVRQGAAHRLRIEPVPGERPLRLQVAFRTCAD